MLLERCLQLWGAMRRKIVCQTWSVETCEMCIWPDRLGQGEGHVDAELVVPPVPPPPVTLLQLHLLPHHTLHHSQPGEGSQEVFFLL